MVILKIMCLCLAIMYGFTCFGRLFTKQNVSSFQIMFMAMGIAGFIALQWLV